MKLGSFGIKGNLGFSLKRIGSFLKKELGPFLIKENLGPSLKKWFGLFSLKKSRPFSLKRG